MLFVREYLPRPMSYDELPEPWVVWSDEPGGRTVLAYRPDVFDTEAFPAACLPTVYLTRGPKERRRPPTDPRGAVAGDWRVTLFLEPEVDCDERSYGTRDAAVDGAVDLARAFHEGGIDYRDAYQVPREAYLDRLDELTGRVRD